jgi:hypothetical protein
VAAAAVAAAACVPFRPPEPATPPAAARVLDRAPVFSVFAPDGTEVASDGFAGRVLVVVAADPGFMAEMLPWIELVRRSYGEPGERYDLVVAVEGTTPGELPRVDHRLPWTIALHADPPAVLPRRPDTKPPPDRPSRLKRAFGLVGEGPHVVAVGPDGTLLALLDGPVVWERAERLRFALDGVLRPVRGPAEESP